MADDLDAVLDTLTDQIEDQLSRAIQEQAQQLSDAQRQALQSLQEAPDDTGNLEASCVVVPGDGPLDFLVQAGGELTTGDIRDGSGVPYDHALAFEFGNSRQPARPFFYSTYNAMRPAMQQAISDAIEKATK